MEKTEYKIGDPVFLCHACMVKLVKDEMDYCPECANAKLESEEER